MQQRSFKDELSSKPAFGTFLKVPSPEIVQMLALAGFDFIICDMEHGQMDESESRIVIRQARAVGLPVIVRLPEPAQGLVNRLLEAGACGIQMPRLRTSEDTKNLYEMMHFPPHGTRSVGTANTSAKFGAVAVTEYIVAENERVLSVGQFETRTIDEPAEPMFNGLDVAFIGPVDLSVDFGVPGQFENDQVQRHVRRIEQIAAAKGVMMGAFASNVDQAKQFAQSGYRFIAVSGDTSMLMSAAKSVMSELKPRHH